MLGEPSDEGLQTLMESVGGVGVPFGFFDLLLLESDRSILPPFVEDQSNLSLGGAIGDERVDVGIDPPHPLFQESVDRIDLVVVKGVGDQELFRFPCEGASAPFRAEEILFSAVVEGDPGILRDGSTTNRIVHRSLNLFDLRQSVNRVILLRGKRQEVRVEKGERRFFRFLGVSLLVHFGVCSLLIGFGFDFSPQGETHKRGVAEVSYLSFPQRGVESGPLEAPLVEEAMIESGGAESSDALENEEASLDRRLERGEGTDLEGELSGDRYRAEVYRKIDEAFVYPRLSYRRGEEGTVELELTIDQNGSLSDLRLLKSSGHETLDRAAIRAIQEAAPFPPPPPHYTDTPHTISFVVSIYN